MIKKLILSTLLFCSFALAQQPNNVNNIGPFTNGGPTSPQQFLGPYFQNSNCSFFSSSLIVTCGPSEIFVGQGPVLINNTQSVTLTANQTTCLRPAMSSCNFIYETSAGTLSVSTSFLTATGNGNTLLAFAQTNASGVTTFEAVYQSADIPSNVTLTDGYFFVPPGACALALSGGTLSGINGLQVVGASNTPVNLLATTTATETTTIVCHITFNSRITAGKGLTLNDVTLLVGNSVGATATCNAPTIGSITLPTPGTGETASTVAPVALTGGFTVTPAVGSCNTAAITAGAFYTEKVALNTPFLINPDFTDLIFSQSFVGPASASYTLYTGGLIVHVSNTPF